MLPRPDRIKYLPFHSVCSYLILALICSRRTHGLTYLAKAGVAMSVCTRIAVGTPTQLIEPSSSATAMLYV